MAQQTYEYNVDMTCEGCSNAVQRVLGKVSDISKLTIDLPSKKVFVTTNLDHNQILESIKKTGKTCSFVGVQK
ncbi:PREDICTED: copper transport protein ATOX1 [Ceratosolen solmsi marchali]|uniref:Copper transport protein ATOX1 n=1 Tax=Ceratosolen solmsi marchali TaxID=326594 RepID=A0AAJ6VKS8_9HYME|nr:PREDICTED: copper transport protein ATOX1 [Ceratosolen solmsi marchali]